MIGFTRITLALLIMAAHLTGQIQMASHFAVMGFYVLAGYFATCSRPSYNSPWQFFSSRYLRLWPCYLVVFVATYTLLMIAPDISPNRMGTPTASWQSVAQYLMLVPAAPYVAVVPVAWFLKWLLLGYGAIALGAASTARRCFVWLGLLFFVAQYWALTADYVTYYFSGALAMLAVSVGSAGYWLDIKLPKDNNYSAIAGAISYPLYLVHPVAEIIGLKFGFTHGWALFAIALIPTLLFSFALLFFVEQPVEKLRKRLRG